MRVGKVNVEREMELARRFGVSSIPTLILFKDGEAVERTGKFKGLVDETDVLAALSGELGKINSGTQIGGYTDLSANIRAAIDVNKNLQNILEKLRGKSENPLAKAIEGALSNAKNRLFNKLSLKNNYDNFSGKEKNVESSVRFYIRTEDIGA